LQQKPTHLVRCPFTSHSNLNNSSSSQHRHHHQQQQQHLDDAMRRWCRREMSNFDYLMLLNHIAGLFTSLMMRIESM
jgi:hypothetical protein